MNVNIKHWLKLFRRAFILSFPLQILVFHYLVLSDKFINTSYTNTIYPFIEKALRFINRTLPFSLSELIFYVLIATILYYIVTHILGKKQKIRWYVERVLFFISLIYFCFKFFWGMNYYRESLFTKLNYEKVEVDSSELYRICKFHLDKINTIRSQLVENEEGISILPFERRDLASSIEEAYSKQEVVSVLPVGSTVKYFMWPGLFAKFGVGGVFSPFTGEAHVNQGNADGFLPATVAHEMAHAMGIAAEDEANFYSYLACSHSDEPIIQYSGYYMAFRYCMGMLAKVDTKKYNELKASRHPGIIRDRIASQKFWAKHTGWINDLSDIFYESYLQSNNQKAGLKSYSMVVNLLVAHHRKHDEI